MNLQTKIPLVKQSEYLIDYNSNVLLLGSCFVENIGKKLDYFKFQNTQNPFGILFHPAAIETLIERSINNDFYSEKDLFFYNEQWHCFDAHSSLSNTSKSHFLNGLNFILEATNKQIQKSSHIIITFGTSWVYRFLKNNKIVANCHKIPQDQFKKELLSIKDVSNSLKKILSLIRSVKYHTTVIFTVSPVRHLKDGFVENMLSKAHLLSAINLVVKKQSFYFPSYEIMMDELRDYRFYAEDMIHPSQTAIDYIWEKFRNVWVSDESFKIMDEVDTIQKGLAHKPFNNQSEAHQLFLKKLETKKIRLQSDFSHISF